MKRLEARCIISRFWQTAVRSTVESRSPSQRAAIAGQNHRFLAENSEISQNTATCFPATASYSNTFERRALCIYKTSVTLKIEKLAGEHGTTLKLIGRIRAEHLAELRGQIAASAPSVLELREVSLVDAEVVRFLSACESEGIQLLNCSAYILEWIVREREIAVKG